MATSRWFMAAACALLWGCASTQGQGPTVDVTGKWAGDWVVEMGRGSIMLDLEQSGADVTGMIVLPEVPQFTGPVTGKVSGRDLSLVYPGGVADLTVSSDVIAGHSTRSRWVLKRR